MLILGRRHGETIQIGDNITITLVEARGGWARIGIDAPQEIPVDRSEIADLVRAEGRRVKKALDTTGKPT